MVKNDKKILANFRLRSDYYKPFKKACEISGDSMTSIIEGLIFSYIESMSEILHKQMQKEKIIKIIDDAYLIPMASKISPNNDKSSSTTKRKSNAN